MKIYISADMEGISGVATNMQLKKDSEYQRFRRLMTADVNAAVEGAFAGGATEVVVCDGHGNMSNILIEELDSRAELISGNNRIMCQMEGIDGSFDGVFLVGYHGREGGNERAVINHTLAGGCVAEIRVNGRAVGEAELNAGVVGFYNVPVLLVTGDEALVEEVREWSPDIHTVQVKRGVDRLAARLLPPVKAREQIRRKAEEAVRGRGRIRPHILEGAVTYEIDFHGTNQALMTTTIPGVERVGPKTVRFTAEDSVTAYKEMWACLIIGMAATRGVLGDVNA
ncbi:D-amino peptidase [Melghirimyces profundicolus]|uniref:D-amino peptidase n=1 Tax=Melghirimyces profundicolus TaxID=1242148 RepID=A0A2T6C0F2_9BACL|nr:M55 family metallopeptidase [Melghirimyces profundicolus]PTX61781.1 D-amino peptidase [Melghirimyces profundicolus]